MPGSTSRSRSRLARSNDETRTRSPSPRARTTATTSSASRRSASKPGSSGSFLISMFTAMPAQASSASSSVGTQAGRSTARRRRHRPPVGQEGVVVDDEHARPALRRTSSSTMSAPMAAAAGTRPRCSPGSTRDAPRCAMTDVTPANVWSRTSFAQPLVNGWSRRLLCAGPCRVQVIVPAQACEPSHKAPASSPTKTVNDVSACKRDRPGQRRLRMARRGALPRHRP